MIYIDSNTMFREAVGYLDGIRDGAPVPKDIGKAEQMLNMLLNYNVGNVAMLSALGAVNYAKGNYGMAIQIYSTVAQIAPDNYSVWNNLGLAWKEVGNYERAELAMKKALKVAPPELKSVTNTNLSALNLNRGRAEAGLQYAKKALEEDPKNVKAHWHYGLANLELRRWEDAWDGHEARLYHELPQEQEIKTRNYHGAAQTQIWEGQPNAKVVVHGEEGIGDEVMFASCIPDLLATGCDVIIEPHPRLQDIFQRSFPTCRVFGTHKLHGEDWVSVLGAPDYKIALGSLPKFFRKSAAAFPGKPYLVPDPVKKSFWAGKLKALGRKPNIGISWQGGVEKTRFAVRSFDPLLYEELFKSIDANWISVQYDPTAAECVARVRDQLGVTIHHWPAAVEMKADVDETAALISSLDCVVTVCQTAVHISGALGVPTFVMTPSEPGWRYGDVPDSTMPWYSSVRLLRQEKGTYDWAAVVSRATREVSGLFKVTEAVAR